ncbi:MAG TPA: cupredoxin family copper-binding protein [Gemmatimonadaceae bacterium]|nr:cupredoxin family copper-binding protein [Gemmatimonadaceae bacterium]
MHAWKVRRLLIAVCGALLALPAAGAARSAAYSAKSRPVARTVAIASFAFAPGNVTVSVGDTVVWRNDDIVPHTATASDSSWDSGIVQPKGTWRMVARARGEWKYICALHPSMRGTLVVR